MDIKKLYESIINFIIKRIVELFGILLSVFGILLLISLVSYAPEDPNFIFSNEVEIQNFLGLKGSYTSDIIFQSLGLISLLLPFTFLFTGLNIFISKKILLLLENTFFSILYILLGSLFLSFFYEESFWLSVNGNGGFVGNYLNQTPFHNLILINQKIFYYILLFLIVVLFLLSINFKISSIKKFIAYFIVKINSKKEISDFENQINEKKFDEETSYVKENRIQEDLPFTRNKLLDKTAHIKFKLPPIEFLVKQKNQRKTISEDKVDESFLEKILLDFGAQSQLEFQ